MIAKSLPLAGGILCLAGCVISTTPTGPLQYDSFHLDRDRSELVKVHLNMGAGKLQAGSGTDKLLQAYFTYNVPHWKPVVRYDPGSLTIDQGKTGDVHFQSGRVDYQWDLRFNRDTPLDFDVNFGAGEAQLDLGALNLRGVNVQMASAKWIWTCAGTRNTITTCTSRAASARPSYTCPRAPASMPQPKAALAGSRSAISGSWTTIGRTTPGQPPRSKFTSMCRAASAPSA